VKFKGVLGLSLYLFILFYSVMRFFLVSICVFLRPGIQPYHGADLSAHVIPYIVYGSVVNHALRALSKPEALGAVGYHVNGLIQNTAKPSVL